MVKSEFIVERQGKSFVLYAGLLDLAHSQGLKRIQTEIVQIPRPENDQVAIVHAEVETERGVYSGIGDASPANVNRGMALHVIRLAETRAKARALRDAVNVGVAALEELGEDVAGEPEAAPPVPFPRGADSATAGTGRGDSAPADAASPAQVRALYAIARERGISEAFFEDQVLKEFGSKPAELTRRQASGLIDRLKAEAPAGTRRR